MKEKNIGKFILIVFVFLLFSPIQVIANEEIQPQETTGPIRGKVLEILEDETERTPTSGEDMVMRHQKLKVEILNGEHKKELITAENVIDQHMAYNFDVEKGDEIILFVEEDENGEIIQAYVAEMVRDKYLLYLAITFVLLLIIVGGLKGVKSVITLTLTVFAILKILLPMILKGHDPVLVSVSISAGIIVITLLIISGFNKKTVAAIIGTAGGVWFAGMVALIIGNIAELTGLGNEEAQMLLYIPQETQFDFEGLLFAGIILGALGAVMDVSMSISSALYEIQMARPDITTKELLQSGMNVGKDIMGTMSNTLILAYSGGAIHLMLLFLAYERPFLDIINMDMIASEVVRALAGSIGLIITIPLTTIVAATISKKDWNKNEIFSKK